MYLTVPYNMGIILVDFGKEENEMIKRTLRKITAITLLSTIIVTAVGCGNTNNENTTLSSEKIEQIKEEASKAVANETKPVTIVDDTTGETKEVVVEIIKKDGETYIKTQDSTGKDILVNEKNIENGVVDTSKKEDETTAQKVIEENKKEQESKAEEIATQAVSKEIATQKETEKVTEKVTEKPTEAPTVKPTQPVTQPTTQAPTTHEHNYVATTSTVHHDAVTHTETVQNGTKTVVDKEAWDENTYNTETLIVCKACGLYIPLEIIHNTLKWIDINGNEVMDNTPYELYNENMRYSVHVYYAKKLPALSGGFLLDDLHAKYCDDNGIAHDPSLLDSRYEPGTYVLSSVHHEAVTHQEPNYETKTVVDKAAWDETITTYKCSCGATK